MKLDKMDRDTYLGNLKTLKELILDEEKLVTYISLSKDLCIHVNDAKSLLNHVCKEIRDVEPKITINVCYLISGLLDNNSACTTVCSEAEIEALRKKCKVVFYEHVYCVSRGVQGVDNVALTAINKFEDLPLCTGLIKAHVCIRRTIDEIGNLKQNSNQAIVIDSQPKLSIAKKHPSEKANETTINRQITVAKANSEPLIKSKTPSPKKDVTVNNNKNSKSKIGNKPVKGIAGFFNKMNGALTKGSKVKLEQEHNVKVELENNTKVEAHNSHQIPTVIKKEEIIIKSNDTNTHITQKVIDKNGNTHPKIDNSDEEMSHTSSTTVVEIKNKHHSSKSQSKTNANSSLKQIKQNAKVDKKRKRLLYVSDSEDDPFDDEDKVPVDHESEDEIPPTPSINTVKITSGIINPKKRRKIVDETYMDEDGFLATKKEEVYESCSDNEADIKSNTQEKENVKQVTQVKIESPQKNNRNKKKKVSPPQKGQQKMMTNFFKKL